MTPINENMFITMQTKEISCLRMIVENIDLRESKLRMKKSGNGKSGVIE